MVVGRLTANGLPDTTFDGDGRAVAGLSLIATIQIGGEAHVVLDDGSIVVSAGNRLVKFGADGIQDTAALKTVFSTNILRYRSTVGRSAASERDSFRTIWYHDAEDRPNAGRDVFCGRTRSCGIWQQ